MEKENRKEILRVENLKQYFKSGSGRNKLVVKAVDGVSFSIYQGEVFSLVGESGCGKTTTARTIIKLYNATGGQVFFQGTKIITDLKAEKGKYKELKRGYNSDRKDELATLKEDLDAGKLSKEGYNKKAREIKNKYRDLIQEARSAYRNAKNDYNFERLIDEEGIKARKDVTTHPEYEQIEKEFKEANETIEQKIKKLESDLELSQDRNPNTIKEIHNLKKELKLNDIRKKQDTATLKYRIVKKNKLLMRQMQMIFQDPISSLNPRMTVKEIIAEGLRINGFKNENLINKRVDEALVTVGLVPEHASRYPHEFSGGQRQRIGIARALIVDPTFIIADEPVSALDVSIRAQVINLLNDLRIEKGITILFIAHDLSVVKYFSDRLAVMYFGHIVEIGNKEKLFAHPLHPYTNSLMDSIPLPDPIYESKRKKRPRYNPAAEHDYSTEAPTLKEIEPDHFVLCNSAEFEKYKKILNES